MRISISAEDAIELTNIKALNAGVKIPRKLNVIGKRIDIITKGAIVTSMYLDLAKNVSTKQSKTNECFLDLIKFGINTK